MSRREAKSDLPLPVRIGVPTDHKSFSRRSLLSQAFHRAPCLRLSLALMVRAKKKQKRLDAIKDNPSLPPPSPSAVRRSSRVRRAPNVLDSSPVPSPRKKRPRIDDSSPVSLNCSGSSSRRNQEVKIQKSISFDSKDHESEAWSFRPKERPKGKTNLKGRKKKKKKKKNKSKFLVNRKNPVNGSQEISPVVDRVLTSSLGGEEGSTPNEKSLPVLDGVQKELSEQNSEEEPLEVRDVTQCEIWGSINQIDNLVEEPDPIPAQQMEATISGEKLDEKVICENDEVPKTQKDAMSESEIKEGRRCGLCGGGTDGRPPKILVPKLNESDKEAYEELAGSEEPNYDVWDGFGDEPGWMGRLLGPIRDQSGITRIWVHQNCAVWSPEV